MSEQEEKFINGIKKLGFKQRWILNIFRYYFKVADGQEPRIPKTTLQKMLDVGLLEKQGNELFAVKDKKHPTIGLCLKGLTLQGFIERAKG